MFNIIGKSVFRKEALNKVTGAAKYTGDYQITGLLYACIVASPYAHAGIKQIHTSEAWKVPGVRAIVAGKQCPILTGSVIYMVSLECRRPWPTAYLLTLFRYKNGPHRL